MAPAPTTTDVADVTFGSGSTTTPSPSAITSTAPQPSPHSLKTAAIVGMVIFLLLLSLSIVNCVILLVRKKRRRQRAYAAHPHLQPAPSRSSSVTKILPPFLRRISTSSMNSQNPALLANAAPPPAAEDDKQRESRMFARPRSESRLTVYIPEEQVKDGRRRSNSYTNLIPLQVQPPTLGGNEDGQRPGMHDNLNADDLGRQRLTSHVV